MFTQNSFVWMAAVTLSLCAHSVWAQPNPLVSLKPAKDESRGTGSINDTMSYYEILGVNNDASEAEIKSAYRKLVMKYHPDTNRGDASAEAKFKLLNEANQTLSDPELRARYDRLGKDGAAGSPHAGSFIRMNPIERAAFLERWLWDDEGEKILETLIADLEKRAAGSAEAFRALVSIMVHEHAHQTGGAVHIRMSAFGALTMAQPHRPEVLQDYFTAVSKVFEARAARSDKKRRSIGSDGGYYVGMVIEAFFKDKELDPEIFRAWLPKMGGMLPKSHSTAWGALLESLPDLNERFPDSIKYFLKVYAKALYDLDRPNIQDPKRPEWKFGRTYNTIAEASNVAEGLLEIARLRPDLEEQVYQALVKFPKLTASGLVMTLIRSAEDNATAFKALRVLLAQSYTEDQRKVIRAYLEQDTANLKRNGKSKTEEEIRRTQRILDLVAGSPALNPKLKAQNWCEGDLI